jgi:hypothetical protein
MADIRINSLPTTATSFNTDDYIAIDGAAGGTRKLLAATPPFTDVTFGSSGPSAKSSINARAARQGLVFDGTAGATTSNVSAFGTGDFTVVAWVNPTSFSTYPAVAGGTNNGSPRFQIDADVAGTPYMSVKNGSAYQPVGGSVISIGVNSMVVWRRASGVLYTSVNAGAEASIAASVDLTQPITKIGYSDAGNIYSGTLSVFIYNRALSAAEVVALYEAGVPAGADYNTASNTALNTTSFSNSSVVPFTTFSGASATGFTATQTSVANARANMTGSTFNTQVGQKFILYYDLTLNSGSAPTAYLGIENVVQTANAVQLTAGTGKSLTLTATAATTGAYLQIGVLNNASTTDFVLSNVKLVRAGLLLAPDAGQAGGGLTWYDTSGNAANITLPASGVAWAVPTSGKIATGLTIGGTGVGLTIAPSSGPASLTLNGAAAGSTVNFALTGTNKYTAEYVNGSDFFAIGRSGVAYDLALKSGNLLVGTTTDSANGKLQLATHTTSAGGIGFGTDWSLYRVDQYSVGLNGTSGGSILRFYESSVFKGQIGTSAGSIYLDSTSGSIILRTNSGTTALTLDSSQRCILAGALRLNNAYTAGAPTATGYVTLQDSAGNTYKVLVGT